MLVLIVHSLVPTSESLDGGAVEESFGTGINSVAGYMEAKS